MRKLLAAVVLCLPLLATADERILSFHSDIRVMSDGWIEVTETIKVRAEGNRILRGIYRDLPTEYFDKQGNRYEVDVEPIVVRRNETSEDFHETSIQDGIRIYFGHRDRTIPHGIHSYTFRYRASRMLGFFDEHDELYWNVTGFDWAFPIDKASARVVLDFAALPTDIGAEAYTGPLGGNGRDYASRAEGNGTVFFEANEPLSAVNGLTVAVTWPKGFVSEPTKLDRFAWLIKDNRNLLFAVAGFALLVAYYIPVWLLHGKDPDEGILITRYEPPDGFSPASLRYIRQMYYDDKVMAAAVVNLAVKGYLKIDERSSRHKLTKQDPGEQAAELAPGEKALYTGLFGKAGHFIELDNENHETLGRAKSAHKQSLQDRYKHKYFQTNGLLNLPGIVIALGTTIAAISIGSGPVPNVLGVIVAMFVTMAVFAVIMKRPTIRGRTLLDEMIGFKDYLEIAEKGELNLRNPPEKTPELFEAYLPFALALGVDQEWSEKFASVLAAIQSPDGRAYQPGWYNGTWNSSSLRSSTRNLSRGLSSAISKSVTPPGSSSGSGGGGYSGGGGGGGGGGGW